MLRAPDNGRQVLGKVVVDLQNGNIWGFPTLTQEPYPIDATGNTKAPTSHPFLLGKFDFAATNKCKRRSETCTRNKLSDYPCTKHAYELGVAWEPADVGNSPLRETPLQTRA